MLLKENKLFKLPRFMGGAFSGFDRLTIPYNILILQNVTQREDNGEIEMFCKAKDGPEEKRDSIRFLENNRREKDQLFQWLKLQIGKDIESIYSSQFEIM